MNQLPNNPFDQPPTHHHTFPLWQPTNPSPDNPGPTFTPNYAPRPNYAPNQGSMSQPSIPPQGYSQQQPMPSNLGQPSWQLPSTPPLPQPGSLPKDYHFPAPSGGNLSAPKQPEEEMTTPTLNPPPVRRRKLRKGRAFVSLLVLLLLIGSGVGAFIALHHSNPNAAKPIAHATATTQPATNPTGAPGQSLQAGPNWLMTITRVHTTTISDFPPKAGQTYLEISITLKNVSPNTQFVSSMLEFTLTDSSGKQYTESVNDTYTRQAVDGHLTIGQTLAGQVAYEVPQSQHQFVLMFHYGLPDGSNAAISWYITIQ